MPDNYKSFTVEELREKFHYDSGNLYHRRGNFKGKVAGSPLASNGGYRYICTSKNGKVKSLLAHRVVWAVVKGEFLEDGYVIDHIDGNPDNNKIENLRVVTSKENSKNRGKRKKKVGSRYVLTSVFGIKFDKKGMCYVVSGNGKELARVDDFDEAKYIRWSYEFDTGFTDRH